MNKVAWASAFSLGCQAIQIICGIMAVPLLLSRLGEAQYSQFVMLWVLASFLPLVDFGLPRSLAQRTFTTQFASSGDEEPPCFLLFVGVGLQLLFFVVLFLFCYPIWLTVVSFQDLTSSILTVPSGILFKFVLAAVAVAVINLVMAFYQGLGSIFRLMVLSNGSNLSANLVPLIAIIQEPTLDSLANWTLCVRMVGLTLAIATIPFSWQQSINSSLLSRFVSVGKDLLQSGARCYSYFALTPLLTYGDRYFSSWMSPNTNFTSHWIASDLSLRCLIVPGLVSQYSFRVTAELSGGKLFDRPLNSYINLMTWSYLLPLIVGIAFGSDLLVLWLGESRVDGTRILCARMALCAVAPLGVSSFMVQLSMLVDRMDQLSLLVILEAVIFFGALFGGLSFIRTSENAPFFITLIWGARIVIEAIAMIFIYRNYFSPTHRWRSIFLNFFLLPIGVLIASTAVDKTQFHIAIKAMVVFGVGAYFALSMFSNRLPVVLPRSE